MRHNSRAAFAAIAISALNLLCPATSANAQEPPSPEKPANSPDTNEPSVTVLGSEQAKSVLGKEVLSSANEDMGRIVDVIVDRTGRVRAAIIDFGGFLGLGSRKIAVDWNALSFAADDGKRDVITLALSRDQVKAAPEYKDKQSVVVLGQSGNLQSLPPD